MAKTLTQQAEELFDEFLELQENPNFNPQESLKQLRKLHKTLSNTPPIVKVDVDYINARNRYNRDITYALHCIDKYSQTLLTQEDLDLTHLL